jgi:hypothetical protein
MTVRDAGRCERPRPEGSKDFFWKATIQELDFEEVALDIHHIFPRVWCEEKGIKPAVLISEANFVAQRLLTLRSRLSAAYKGVNVLVLREEETRAG